MYRTIYATFDARNTIQQYNFANLFIELYIKQFIEIFN